MSQITLSEIYVTEIQPRFEAIMARFNSWTHGLRQLEVLLANDSDVRQRQACMVLRMYQSLFAAMLNSFPSGACFDRFDEDLFTALKLAESLLQIQDQEAKTRTNISLALGVIPVLFVIAWRSNHVFLRDQSLELLRLSNGREGIWDGKVAFEIARRFVALKALGVEADSGCHIQISELQFDSENTCQLICRVVGSETPPVGNLMPFEGSIGERRIVETIHLESS